MKAARDAYNKSCSVVLGMSSRRIVRVGYSTAASLRCRWLLDAKLKCSRCCTRMEASFSSGDGLLISVPQISCYAIILILTTLLFTFNKHAKAVHAHCHVMWLYSKVFSRRATPSFTCPHAPAFPEFTSSYLRLVT